MVRGGVVHKKNKNVAARTLRAGEKPRVYLGSGNEERLPRFCFLYPVL